MNLKVPYARALGSWADGGEHVKGTLKALRQHTAVCCTAQLHIAMLGRRSAAGIAAWLAQGANT